MTYLVFKSMIKRDLLIQFRNWREFVFRVAMLPFILILTYGYLLPKIGILSSNFPSQMFPGMIGMSLLVTGIHGTAVPLSMDFNMSREIEDRLQAPVDIKLTAIAKMTVGIIEALIGAAIVLPISLLFMAHNIHVNLSLAKLPVFLFIIILSSLTSASLGLLVGTIVKPNQIAAMFPGFLMPLIFTGAIFFTWSDLSKAIFFKYLYLLNPLVYINESLRYILVDDISAIPIQFSVLAIIIFIIILGYWGIHRFIKIATS